MYGAAQVGVTAVELAVERPCLRDLGDGVEPDLVARPLGAGVGLEVEFDVSPRRAVLALHLGGLCEVHVFSFATEAVTSGYMVCGCASNNNWFW